MIGDLTEPMDEMEFLEEVKKKNRYTNLVLN